MPNDSSETETLKRLVERNDEALKRMREEMDKLKKRLEEMEKEKDKSSD